MRERPKTDKGRPDHELRVGIDPERKLGSLRYAGGAGEQRGVWYVGGQPIQHEEVYYEYMGNPQKFPPTLRCRSTWFNRSVNQLMADERAISIAAVTVLCSNEC